MVRIPTSRTAVPALPAWSVPRPGLWRQLASARPDQLVAVIAPAGSGKTVLLAEWARHAVDGPATAWVGLDRDDADPGRFWSAVLAGVLACRAVPADSPLHALRGRVAAGDGEDLADALLDALETLRPAVRLVLDDVHVLADRHAGPRALARLVRHRPAGVHLVLAARSDPAVGLPRLRVEDGLHELRATGLRFTVGEAAALATSCGVALRDEEVALLHRRTEGWAAGLRLAVLALRRGGQEAAAFLAGSSGDERSIADYLSGELLAGLDADDRKLLEDLSVGDRLPDPLALALTGRPDVAQRLEGLAHGLGMIERSDAGEHRVHTLLRSHLAADLARRRPARYRRQHATAARWWADHAEPARALHHAEQADDAALTADLLRRVAVPLLLRGEHHRVRRALGAVDGPALRRDPYLTLVAALVHLDAREHPAAAARLRLAGEAWPAAPGDPALTALRTVVELFVGAPASSRAVPDDPDLVGLLHLARGTSLLAAGHGETTGARAELLRALSAARAGGLARLEADALDGLALAAVAEGDPAGVSSAAEAALAAERPRPPARRARTVALLAWAELVRGDASRAADRCTEALAPADRLDAADAYALHAVHGAAVGDLGQLGAGVAEARAARGDLGDAELPSPLAAAFGLLEHRAALRLGNLRAAGEVASWLSERTATPDEALLTRAWTEAASGRWDVARTIVAPLSGRVRAPATVLVEAHLLAVEAALRAEDTAQGRAALDAALAAGRDHDVVRPFTLAGPRTRAFLRERPAARPAGFAERAAAACAAIGTEAAPPLSERELVVLALLPSLLDAPTMAEELVVSVNTVKTQIRSIYAKLGVSTRRAAVSRARERGLLVWDPALFTRGR